MSKYAIYRKFIHFYAINVVTGMSIYLYLLNSWSWYNICIKQSVFQRIESNLGLVFFLFHVHLLNTTICTF